MAKLHYLKFYPESWIAEISLRMCSLAARGLWIDLICHMAKSPEHGVLLTMTGKPITDAQVAAFVGVDQQTVLSALRELEDNGVLSRREDEAIFSRRMVRDHAKYVRQVSDGSRGGRPRKGTPKGTVEDTPKGTPEGTPKACVDSSFLVLGSRFSSGEEGTKTEQKKAGEYSAQFEAFWQAFPRRRRVDKVECGKLWRAKGLDGKAAVVMAGLDLWNRSKDWTKDNGDYTPEPAKWLRRERWQEPPGDVAPGAAPKPPDRFAEHRGPAAQWFLSLPAERQREAASGDPDGALGMAKLGTVPNDVLFAYRDATKGVTA